MKENAKNDRGKPRNSQDLIARAKAEAAKRAEAEAKKATLKTDANGRKRVSGYDKSRPGEMPTLAQLRLSQERAGAESLHSEVESMEVNAGQAKDEESRQELESQPDNSKITGSAGTDEASSASPELVVSKPTEAQSPLLVPIEDPITTTSKIVKTPRVDGATNDDFTDLYLREFNEPIDPERLLSPSTLGFLKLAKEVGYETAGRLMLLIDIQRRCGKVDFFTHPELADFIGIGSRQVSKRMIDDLIKRGLVIDHGLRRSRRALDFSKLVGMLYPADDTPG